MSGSDIALDVLIAIIASAAFCLVVLLLVVVLHRKDPLCCRFRPFTDDHPHYNSRQTSVGVAHGEHTAATNQGAAGPQLPGGLFIVGKPNSYYMESPPPRLPSYESVRRKDRQRQVHGMIAQRFGLSGCHDEPPPPYEDSLHQPIDRSPVHLPSLGAHRSTRPQRGSPDRGQPSTARQGPAPPSCRARESRFVFI